MLNQVIIIGRIVEKPSIFTFDDGSKCCDVTLAINRPFKNMNGEYDTDFISASLWNASATSAEEYCDKGDTIGIKGRLIQKVEEIEGIRRHYLALVGERVIFINLKSRYSGSVGSKVTYEKEE